MTWMSSHPRQRKVFFRAGKVNAFWASFIKWPSSVSRSELQKGEGARTAAGKLKVIP